MMNDPLAAGDAVDQRAAELRSRALLVRRAECRRRRGLALRWLLRVVVLVFALWMLTGVVQVVARGGVYPEPHRTARRTALLRKLRKRRRLRHVGCRLLRP
jgi:hypothetical protein